MTHEEKSKTVTEINTEACKVYYAIFRALDLKQHITQKFTIDGDDSTYELSFRKCESNQKQDAIKFGDIEYFELLTLRDALRGYRYQQLGLENLNKLAAEIDVLIEVINKKHKRNH
jgi:hypothetical protein